MPGPGEVAISRCPRRPARDMHRAMQLSLRSLWPEAPRRPWTRLAVALVAAPLVLATILTLVAFLVGGATEFGPVGTMAFTRRAAMAFFIFLPVFTLTFGLAGVAALAVLGRRGVLAWLLAGAAAGLAAAATHGLAFGAGLVPFRMIVAGVLGTGVFALVRWFAGVRRR